MPPLSRLLCLIGRHRRSRGHARRVPGGYRSRCKRCGIAMKKSEGGAWTVDAAVEEVPAPAKIDATSASVEPAPPAAETEAKPASVERRRFWPIRWKRKRDAA